jgi:hypothetical protein
MDRFLKETLTEQPWTAVGRLAREQTNKERGCGDKALRCQTYSVNGSAATKNGNITLVDMLDVALPMLWGWSARRVDEMP